MATIFTECSHKLKKMVLRWNHKNYFTNNELHQFGAISQYLLVDAVYVFFLNVNIKEKKAYFFVFISFVFRVNQKWKASPQAINVFECFMLHSYHGKYETRMSQKWTNQLMVLIQKETKKSDNKKKQQRLHAVWLWKRQQKLHIE